MSSKAANASGGIQATTPLSVTSSYPQQHNNAIQKSDVSGEVQNQPLAGALISMLSATQTGSDERRSPSESSNVSTGVVAIDIKDELVERTSSRNSIKKYVI